MKKMILVVLVIVIAVSIYAQLNEVEFNEMKNNVELLTEDQAIELQLLLEGNDIEISGLDEYSLIKKQIQVWANPYKSKVSFIVFSFDEERWARIKIIMKNGTMLEDANGYGDDKSESNLMTWVNKMLIRLKKELEKKGE